MKPSTGLGRLAPNKTAILFGAIYLNIIEIFFIIIKEYLKMFLFILGILILLAAIVSMFVVKGKIWRIVRFVATILAVAAIFISCFSMVPTGFTGVLTTFGKVEDNTIESGLNFKAPWQNIVLMDNREKRGSFSFSAFSSDIQQVNIKGSINYSINKQTSMTLYREVGSQYFDVLIAPRIYENTKSAFSHYTAEELVSKRDVLSDEILALMQQDLNSYGINVIAMAIEDIDFTDAFTDAVEAKQVAQQQKLRAETEQQQKTMEAEAAATIRRTQADAEAYETTVKAEAEAKANELINASLTDKLIKYNQANKWNGELPNVMVGNSETVPIINIQEGEGVK